MGSCAFGQRYEGWTENPNGSTSYTHGRFVQYRTIDDELQESYQAMMDYLKDSQLQRDQEKAEAMAKSQLEELEKQTALLEETKQEAERANEERRSVAEATKRAMETLAQEAERANEERRSVAEATKQAMETLAREAKRANEDHSSVAEAAQPTTGTGNRWTPYVEEEKRRNVASAASDKYTQLTTAAEGDQWWAADVAEEKRIQAEKRKYTQPTTTAEGDQWWAADVAEEKRRRAEERNKCAIPVEQPAYDSAR